jgi:spoIIIJ-associated protein
MGEATFNMTENEELDEEPNDLAEQLSEEELDDDASNQNDNDDEVVEEQYSQRYVPVEMNLSEDELDAIADTTIEVLRKVLYYFNSEQVEIEEYEGDEDELIFDIVGENLGMLIGRHGRTLEAIQLLVSAMVSRKIGYHYPVVIDVEGYVNRRKQKLIALARSSAARAIRSNRSVRLRPMTASERRIVHMTLKEDKRVRTESEGSDPNRQIVIYLA